MSSNSFPPLRNLPHWSRVGCLDKSCVARPLPVNLLRPLAGPAPADRPREASAPGDRDTGVRDTRVMDPRVASLHRNIEFLQQQHRDILHKLHGEIDELKRENKELQYKLIMEPPKACRKGVSQRGSRPPTQGSEVHAQRGLYLEQALLDTQDHGPGIEVCSDTPGPPRPEHDSALRGGLITSLQPLRIHSGPSHLPRAPSLQECEVIIRQLYNANSLQSQEIIRVKAVLRDIVYNKKITPENYILTKAYLADGTRTEAERFPKLALQPLPKNTAASQARGAERVLLPALKQSLGSSMAQRQKRSHAAQRSRLRRTVL